VSRQISDNSLTSCIVFHYTGQHPLRSPLQTIQRQFLPQTSVDKSQEGRATIPPTFSWRVPVSFCHHSIASLGPACDDARRSRSRTAHFGLFVVCEISCSRKSRAILSVLLPSSFFSFSSVTISPTSSQANSANLYLSRQKNVSILCQRRA